MNKTRKKKKLTNIISPIIWSVFELSWESDINVESFGYKNGFGFIGNKTLHKSENTEENNKTYFFIIIIDRLKMKHTLTMTLRYF